MQPFKSLPLPPQQDLGGSSRCIFSPSLLTITAFLPLPWNSQFFAANENLLTKIMEHETKLWGFLCSKTQGDVFKMSLCSGLHTCCHGRPCTDFIQFSSVAQSCLTLCDPMDCSMPGFPVHHQLPELAQSHVHRVSDAIQPSHPLSSPSSPAFNLSQRQGLFKWVSSSHQVAKVLEFQHQSFQWIFRTDFL